MANSIAPIAIGTDWVDLYAESEWPAGSALAVEVLAGVLQIAVSGTEPTTDIGLSFGAHEIAQIDGGQSGAWARAVGADAVASVQPAHYGIRRFPFSDPRVVDGEKAFTVQSFSELNSKRGTQYEAAFYSASLASGAAVDLAFVIGAGRVLIKDISVQFDSAEIATQLFRAPTYTGGTALGVYNLNDQDAVAGTVSVLSGVTTSNPGIAVGPQTRSLGSEAVGNRAQSSFAGGVGVERVLRANATYLYRVTNTGAEATRIAGVSTWYQGPLSVDVT